MIRLEPGQELGDHQVKEHAFVVVVEGRVRLGAVRAPSRPTSGRWRSTSPTSGARSRAPSGARLLLLLSPWPGEGHYRGGDAPGTG